jgi:hypothetical protein
MALRARRVLRWMLGTLLVLAALFGALLLILRNPLPRGTPGPEADARARAMLAALGGDAWARTGAVRWTFRGSRHHLWDRLRHRARVRWDDVEVLVDLLRPRGSATRGGREVTGQERDDLVRRAHAYWINDAFWIAAPFKVFDEGVVREAVVLDRGQHGLLATWSKGGLTPGDSYLWILGPNARPAAWRMWVSILPVGGLELRIDEWTPLSTGALVATRHSLLGLSLRLGDVAGAATLADLEPGSDPFRGLGD